MRAAVAALLALALITVSLASPDRPTTQYFEAGKVNAAFAKGSPLLENGQYKIHASRREQPGMAEVHVRDTDIIHVLEGKALFVVGGTVVDGKATAQDEVRGSRIELGTEYKLSKGDVFVVPNGTPHWFKEVDGPLLYYVVKVTS
jgi:glc operon protein GlcG